MRLRRGCDQWCIEATAGSIRRVAQVDDDGHLMTTDPAVIRGMAVGPSAHAGEVPRMSNGFLRVAAIGALFVVAGCGGGSTGSAAPAPAAPAAASIDTAGGGAGPASAEPPVASAEASTAAATPEPPSGGGGGGAAAGVCELVTADELAQIFGVASVKTTVIAGPPDNCIVEDGEGTPLTAWSLTTAQAAVVFDAFAADPASVEVPGIGDKAAIVQNTGLLVLKGSSLAVISISGGADMSEEESVEASKQIAALAAGRM